jgi:hypothetical protein
MAGTGKSTVSRTVVARYDGSQDSQKCVLGASFFFSKGGGDFSHASKLVTSIAVQLAKNVGLLKGTICEAIDEQRDIASQSLDTQWQQLILGPLSKLKGGSNQSRYILVVDALDECNESHIRIVLRLLAKAQSLKLAQLRIFITSRPEEPIRDSFNRMEAEHQDFVYHHISPSEHSIRIFLRHELNLIARKYFPDRNWPGDNNINHLVHNAGGLFIWAATACRFIEQGPFAQKNLDILLGNVNSAAQTEDHGQRLIVARLREVIRTLVWNAFEPLIWIAIAYGSNSAHFIANWRRTILEGGTNTPESCLDGIYTTVLLNAINSNRSKSCPSEDNQNHSSELKNVLESIVTMFSPLSAESLSILIKTTRNVRETLTDLHAILDIPDYSKNRNIPLRLHHPSFRDFLLDSKRCNNPKFQVDEKQAHETLAERCIQLMSKCFEKICNRGRPAALVAICNGGRPGTLVTEVDSKQVEQHLPPEMQYACLYWIQHLEKGGVQLSDNDQVHQFLQEHLLYWLEALGWMGKTLEGIRAILYLEAYVLVSYLSTI